MNSVRSIVALVALTLVLAGCGADDDAVANASASRSAGANYPATVESCQRSETFTSAPQRVVLGWATSIRTLDALGVADRVTGYVSGSNVKLPDGFTATEVSPKAGPALATPGSSSVVPPSRWMAASPLLSVALH